MAVVTNNSAASRLILVLGAGLLMFGSPGGAQTPPDCSTQTPAVPSVPPAGATGAGTYMDICNTIVGDMTAFNQTLKSSWNGTQYPFLSVGELTVANANTGPTLISNNYLTYTTQGQILALKALGVQAIKVEVGFPIVYEPFYGNPNVAQQYVNYYEQVAQMVRANGLKLIVENQCLTSGLTGSDPNAAAFYSTLTWDQYVAGRAQMAQLLVQTMHPDYFIALEEPKTEMEMSGQANADTVIGSTDMLNQILASIQQANVPGMKVGAGVGAWQPSFQSYISSFTQQGCSANQPCINMPLDFIDMHIFQVNNAAGPNNNYLGNAMTIAQMAAATSKPVTISESWDWKMLDSEISYIASPSGSDNVMARNAYSFWTPEDVYFIQTMENFASSNQMLFLSFFPNQFFWANLKWGPDTENLTTQQIVTQVSQAEGPSMRVAGYTPLAMGYYQSLPTLGSSNVPAPDTMPPNTPTLQASNAQSSSVTTFTWSAAADNVGTAGYYIYRNNGTTPIATTISTSYQDSGLQNYTTYNYQVVAFDLAGNKAAPLSFSITTLNSQPPNPPTNLSGTSPAPTKVSLTWSAPTGIPITSYSILAGTSTTNPAKVGSAAGTATSATVSNLTPGTLYYFQVEATASGKTSGPSNTASVQTLNGPSAPAGVTATAASAQTVALNWQASTGGLAIRSYNVSRGTTAANLAPLGVANRTTYTDSTASPRTAYYYAVQAVDTGNNQSPFSTPVSVVTPSMPAVPRNVSAAASSSTRVTVTWTEATSGLPIATYTVYRGTSKASLGSLGVTKNTSYTDTTAAAGQTYYYAVQAKDTGGDLSPMSATATVTTPMAPAAPTALAATANTSTKVTVTWSESSPGLPITSYKIWRGSTPSNLSNVATRTSATYIDTTVTSGNTYYYAVQAVDSGGDVSAMSAAVAVTTP